MLTVQMMIGTVEAERTKGRSQRRYHGYTTGAQRSDAAIGHANVSGDHSVALLLSQSATRNPQGRPAQPQTAERPLARAREHRIIEAETPHVSSE
jgi:hypothetical protein